MEEAMGISSNNDEEDDTATQVVKVTKNWLGIVVQPDRIHCVCWQTRVYAVL